MTKRKDTAFFIEKAKGVHGDLYGYEKAIYYNNAFKVTLTCREHGDFEIAPANHYAGKGCPLCARKRTTESGRLTQEEVIARFKRTHGDAYDYSQVRYTKWAGKVTVICPTHGPFQAIPATHAEGAGCQKCGVLKQADGKRASLEEFVENAKRVHGDKYDYSKAIYKTALTKLVIICPKHGEFTQSPGSHLAGHGCPSCVSQTSTGEREIADFLAKHTTVELRNRTKLAPKEIDIWLPEHNLGVEYHGLYWHTDARVGAQHRTKWELANAAGIKLLQVFEDEWRDNRSAVENRRLANLGVGARRYARNCTVCSVTPLEAKSALTSWHTQGVGTYGAVLLGLRHEGHLVAVATFGKVRFGRDRGAWEVLRYASEGTVVGGFGKLLAEFRRTNKGKIVSYCDLRYGNGRLYEATGFTLEQITEPDYWWTDRNGGVRIPRYQTQKHRLPTHPILKEFYRPELTEREICEAAGWSRISGVGHQKWVLT